jgi:hypothetical protein
VEEPSATGTLEVIPVLQFVSIRDTPREIGALLMGEQCWCSSFGQERGTTPWMDSSIQAGELWKEKVPD